MGMPTGYPAATASLPIVITGSSVCPSPAAVWVPYPSYSCSATSYLDTLQLLVPNPPSSPTAVSVPPKHDVCRPGSGREDTTQRRRLGKGTSLACTPGLHRHARGLGAKASAEPCHTIASGTVPLAAAVRSGRAGPGSSLGVADPEEVRAGPVLGPRLEASPQVLQVAQGLDHPFSYRWERCRCRCGKW